MISTRFANKMIGNIGKKSHKSQQTIKSLKGIERNFQWMCWEQMKTLFGEEKAQKKIDSGKLEDRPGPDTGLDGFSNKEWKVWFDTGANKELDVDSRILIVDEDLEGKEAQEMLSNFKEFQGCLAGNVALTQVKTEPEDETKKEGKDDKEGQKENDPEDVDLEEDKTFIDLQKAPRQVLRNVGETLTTLKGMYELTGRTKYCEGMQADISKMIPKFGQLFRQVEVVEIKKHTPQDVDPQVKLAALKALATKVDADLADFEELKEAYEKWFPASKKQRKKA